MATRTVSTKMAIEGESEYRASLSRINAEIKTLSSGLALTKSEFQTNANSMEALTAKGDALSRLYEAQAEKVKTLSDALSNAEKAEQRYAAQKAELTAQIEKNKTALDALKNSSSASEEEQKKLSDETARLESELSKCNANIEASQKGVNSWQDKLNTAKIKLNDLDAELKKNDQYLDEAKNSTDGCATSIDQFGNRAETTRQGVDALAAALGAAGLARAYKEVFDALNACVDASVKFESAMAGVAKTTDLTEDELSTMSESIKEMSTRIPIAADELAGITEAAGQLGISKDNLLSFTETMANLGVATNLTSEEAATMLAQFSAITGMDATKYENLGSTIVALGNSFATNERKITEMAQNIAGAGTNAGMSEQQMLAFSAAITSLGIEAGNGGTQMSKLIGDIQLAVETGKDLEAWAEAAGMSAEEFADKWRVDAAGAITSFIGNLNNLESSSVATLASLGVTETRMQRMITSLANAESKTGTLTRALDVSNAAWDQNTALVKEASTRYETTESKFQLLENSATNLKIAIGDQLTPALANLSDAGADVLNWASDFVEQNGWVVPSITALTAALGVLTAGVVGYTFATRYAIPAIQAFNAALTNPANVVGAVVTALTTLIAVVGTLITFFSDSATPTVMELTETTRGLNDALNEVNETYKATSTSVEAAYTAAGTYAQRLAELEAQGLSTKAAQEEYRGIVDQLNALIPDLNLAIDEQTGLLEDGTDALLRQVDAWKQLALEEALNTKYSDSIKAWADAQLEVYENTQKLTQAQAEEAAMRAEYANAEKRYEQLENQMIAVMENMTLSAEEQERQYDELKAAYDETGSKMESLYYQLEDNAAMQDVLNHAIEGGTKIVEENEKVVTDARNALNAFAETENKMAGTVDQTAAYVKEYTANIEMLESAYKSLNAGTQLTEQQIKALCSAYPQINALVKENGTLNLQNGEIAKQVTGIIASGNAQRRAEEIKTLETVRDSVRSETKALYDLAHSYDVLTNSILAASYTEEYRKNVITLNELDKTLQKLRNSAAYVAPTFNDIGTSISSTTSKVNDAVSSLDAIGNAVSGALKARYDAQRAAEEQTLNDSIVNWEKWQNETVAAIQAQIDALDALEKQQESEDKRAEYERKKQALELQRAYEKDAYQREQYQKEINRLVEAEQERINKEARDTIRSKLNDQIDAAKAQADAQKDALDEQLEALKDAYDKRTSTAALAAEAEKTILKSSQSEILKLLEAYGDAYESLGKSLGDRLADGFAAGSKSVASFVSGIQSGVYSSQSRSVSGYSSSGSVYTPTVTSPPPVNVTVNFNTPVDSPVEVRREIEKVMNQVAAQVAKG